MTAASWQVWGRIGVLILVGLVATAAIRMRDRRPARSEAETDQSETGRKAIAARDLGLESGGWLLFTSTTCSPCKRIRSELATTGATWAEVDVDDHPEIFRLWHVYRVPTLVWTDGSGTTRERHGPASAREAIASS